MLEPAGDSDKAALGSATGSKPLEGREASSWRYSPWYMLAALTLVNTVNWADRQVVPILFPGIRAELGLSDTQLGIIGGLAFSFIYALTAFVFGYAADHRIRRNIVVFGLLLWSMATAASGLATDFASLFAARFFTGVGEASLYPAAMSLIAERFPRKSRGRAMGLFGAAAAVGGGLGVGVGGALAEAFGWRNVFFLYGALGVAALPLLLSVPERPRPPLPAEDDHTLRIVGGLMRDRRLLSVWFCGLVMIAAGIGYGAWVPSFFVRTRGLAVSSAGYLFGAAAIIGGVVGSVGGGLLADRGRARRLAGELDVSAIVALLAVPFVVATLTVTWTPLFVVAGLLAPVAIYAFFPALQTVIVEIVPPRRHGLAYAINILFLGGIGSALGPFLIGAVSDASGSLGAAMVVPLVGMLIAAWMAKHAGRTVRRHTSKAG